MTPVQWAALAAVVAVVVALVHFGWPSPRPLAPRPGDPTAAELARALNARVAQDATERAYAREAERMIEGGTARVTFHHQTAPANPSPPVPNA